MSLVAYGSSDDSDASDSEDVQGPVTTKLPVNSDQTRHAKVEVAVNNHISDSDESHHSDEEIAAVKSTQLSTSLLLKSM